MMDFSRIGPDDYEWIKPYFEDQHYPLCSYSLPALISWQSTDFSLYGTKLDNSILFKGVYHAYPNEDHLILPVSPEKEASPEDLRRIADTSEISTYWFVPDTYIAQHGEKTVENFFEIIEQPGYHDYVYRKEDLATLKGNRYAKKRNLVRQFTRNFATKNQLSLEPITSEVVDECLIFLDEWCMERDCRLYDDYDLACEYQAFTNLLKSIDELQVFSLLLRINGKICAIAVGARLTRDTGALHFEKAFTKYIGLYQYFDRICAEKLFPKVRYINKESDMGVPGLKKAKKSYHPIKMIKSYKLILKP